MEASIPGSRTYLAEAIVDANGCLTLKASSALPFKPGDRVALTISALPQTREGTGEELTEKLRGTVLRYDSPFEAATAPQDWEAAN